MTKDNTHQFITLSSTEHAVLNVESDCEDTARTGGHSVWPKPISKNSTVARKYSQLEL